MHLTIYFPTKLVFGNGSLDKVASEILDLSCSRVLIITIKALVGKLKKLVEELESNQIHVLVDTGIDHEPSFKDFESLLGRVSTFNADLVLGIGGGSALDAAKLAAAQLGNEQTLAEVVGIGMLKTRARKLICMPATSGTGSEVSPNAILVDNADNQKKGIISPYLVPDIVYVDPQLTLSVPRQVTAATGLDALTHCLEAYVNKFAHPFIDIYAYEGMRLIAANLVQAVINGGDEEARTQVAMGSMLGGFCLGPVNTAGVHALSYPLGSMFHVAHGLSNALLLPYVMEFNISASPCRYRDVALALGCAREKDDVETANKGVEKIRSLIKECGLPSRLRDVGVTRESIPEMAAAALKIQRLLKNNPREINEEDAVAIYSAAF